MNDAVHETGVAGFAVGSRDHICALFSGQRQRDHVLLPYLRSGLDRGDKCVVILDDDDPIATLAPMADQADLDKWVATEHLDVLAAVEPEVPAGKLTVAEMLAGWDGAVAATRGAGRFGFVRGASDATWWVARTDPDTLVRYESALTSYLPDDLSVLCLYDLDRFSGRLLVDAVRVHPFLHLGSTLIENPYYLTPQQLTGSPVDADPADWPTESDIRALVAAA
jgi:hypothetical protein